MTKELEDSEEARAEIEEEVSVLFGVLQHRCSLLCPLPVFLQTCVLFLQLERIRKQQEGQQQQQQQQKEESAKPFLLSNQGGDADADSHFEFEGLSSSIVALDRLIRDATEMDEDQLSFDFVQQLARVAKGVKADMSEMQSAKQKAETKFSAATAADEDMEYELASSRELLREARDQLLDSREEAEQLQAEVASLRLELEKRSGTKRTFEGRSESEDDVDDEGDDHDDLGGDDDVHSPNSKRRRGDLLDSVQV